MNYIVEINLFRDWVTTSDIGASSINLWYALMHINNKCGWKERFNVSISTLQSETRYSRSEIYRAREFLINSGRIKCEERSGNRSAVYSIVPFAVVDKSVDKVFAKERSMGHSSGHAAERGKGAYLNDKKVN